MGTPSYMSPEQCKGTGEVDHRADLYSLGCILYELMCARPPFTSRGSGELIGAHLYVQPNPPSEYEPNISPAMEKLIVKLLDKEPDRRVQSASELAQKLGEIAAAHDFQIQTLTPIPGSFRASQLIPKGNNEPVSRTEYAPDIEVTPAVATVAAEPPEMTDKPTTLSSAVSHSVVGRPERGRRRLVVGAAVLVLCIVGGVGFVLSRGGGDGTTTTAGAPIAAPAHAVAQPAPLPPQQVAPPAAPPPVIPAPPVTPPPPAPPALTASGGVKPAAIHKPTVAPKHHPIVPSTSTPTPADKKIDGPIETDL